MNFSLVDGAGLLLAVAVGGAIVILPGWGLARVLGVARREGEPVDGLTGLLVGLAVLPLLASLAIRSIGLEAALGLDLVGAIAAAVAWSLARDTTVRPRGAAFGLLAVWFVVLAYFYVDFDTGHRLYQSFTVVDTVKHAATTQAIADSGAPPRDPFFLRPNRAGYYYFFYALPAMTQRLCFGLVDAKAAFGGFAFWTGVGLFGLIRLVLARCGLECAGSGRRLNALVMAVLASSGLDSLAVLVFAWRTGFVLPAPEWWNEQVTCWLETMLWVPHHLTALIAGVLALVVLSDAGSSRRFVRSATFAALCLASSFGLSIWVTLGLGATILFWAIVLLVERRWAVVGLIAVAGLVALCLALPQFADLHAGRSGGSALPIALTVRSFTPVNLLLPNQPWNMLGRLVLLPVNYLFEFGAMGIGAIVFWRRRHLFADMGELGRVLTISAVVGLLLGAFLTSTTFNNDLGMRVVLFPFFLATVWTVAVLDRTLPAWSGATTAPRLPAALFVALLLGYGTTGYLAFSLRFYRLLPLPPSMTFLLMDSATVRDLREAYAWANATLPKSSVLQHDPAPRRAVAFGLYSRNQVAVADQEANLFGADPVAVARRVAAIAPIFATVLPEAEIRRIAAANGIDDLVVTSRDAVWEQPTSFVWTAAPVYASPTVRILSVAASRDR